MLSTGCAVREPAPEIRLQRIEPPAALLACADPPDVPGDSATQRDVAAFVAELFGAYDDCRAKVGEVRAWVEEAR
jgi:hypothetical protein